MKFYNAEYERQILGGKIIKEEQLEWHRILAQVNDNNKQLLTTLQNVSEVK